MSSEMIITLISTIVGISGFIFGIWQYRNANKVKKAEFLDRNLRQMREDKDIADVLYELQYHQFRYTAEFHNTEKESKVDKALQFLSYICYLRDKHILNKEEFSFFEVDIHQALLNFPLRDYFYNLYHREYEQYKCKNKEEGQKRFTFRYMLLYGRKLGLIGDSFYDPNAWKHWGYHHYLNWGGNDKKTEDNDFE